jgi:hypothetical protein
LKATTAESSSLNLRSTTSHEYAAVPRRARISRGLAFKAHILCMSLNSRLEHSKQEARAKNRRMLDAGCSVECAMFGMVAAPKGGNLREWE